MQTHRCDSIHPPEYIAITTAIVSGIFCLFTIPGNFLVCLAVFKDPFKDLRSPFTLFIAHLAFADLMVGLVTEPLSVYFHIKESLRLPIEHSWLTHMSYFMSCTASVLSIGALTIDRYIAITSPLTYRAKKGSKRTRIVSFVVLFVSLTIPFVYFKVGYIVYAFVFANTAIIFTFVTLLIVQVKIWQTSKSRITSVDHQGTSASHQKIVLREKRITKSLVFVLMAFAASYFPSCVIIYSMNFCTSCSCLVIHWLRDLQFLFVLLNSFVNPLIYAWRLPGFRRALVAIVKRR
ncbi:trace amine-associated receptor 9-like [Actinia tenebrosa]|uniref:Trace amine-associated receptor 9-like n=1 Tax=Actinia tenebrosa TaxID=6105 RepID=A0A6P8IXD4_ACTTE|nr:trace amine-associated receptor 9-like [Actinia tenebrosa]